MGDFKYYKYGFSSNFKQEKNLSVKLGYEEYHKDFLKGVQSDVNACIYKIGAGFILLDSNEIFLDTNLDFLMCNKRCQDDPHSEYGQTRIKGSIEYKPTKQKCLLRNILLKILYWKVIIDTNGRTMNLGWILNCRQPTFH